MDGGYVTWPALLCLAQHSWLMVSAAMVMMVADSPPHAFLEIPGIGPVLNIVYFMKYLPVWGVSSWLWLLLHIRKFMIDSEKMSTRKDSIIPACTLTWPSSGSVVSRGFLDHQEPHKLFTTLNSQYHLWHRVYLLIYYCLNTHGFLARFRAP